MLINENCFLGCEKAKVVQKIVDRIAEMLKSPDCDPSVRKLNI